MPTKVTVTGLDDMKAQLAALGPYMENQVAHGAALDVAKVLKEEVIRRAPVRSGNLRDNIIVKRDPEQSGHASYEVLVRKIKVSKKARRALNRLSAAGINVALSNDPYYWRFQEFGHNIVRRGRIIGVFPARPFFRPAIEAVKGAFIGIASAGVMKRIDAFLKKGK